MKIGERSLFEAAVNLPPQLRDDLVSSAAGHDSALKARVRRLLDAHDRAQDHEPENTPTVEPDRIGPYTVLRKLGEGGMGTVYLAEQRRPLRRRVAIKVVRRGMNNEGVIRRFEMERQALALMTHPGIARIFDAGATDDGRPYFVMEYVPGEPITRFCDRRRLSVDERLALLIQVCEAVQHAHQRGVIHRDLKPSNIMVSEEHGRPAPRVIDFGVAKAVGADLAIPRTSGDGATLTGWPSLDPNTEPAPSLTGAGALVGTPEFMSPEQAIQSNADVDTRTDVYALGMVLYELLVGALPFEQGQSWEEVLATTRLGRIEPPSERLQSLGRSRLETTCVNRSTRLPRLRAWLRRDLDWIVLKALNRDREARYPSTSELAQDLRRHRDRRPVSARHRGLAYVLCKMFMRHRMAVAAGLALIVSAFAYGAILVDRQRMVRAALDESVREAQRANLITNGVLAFFQQSIDGDSALTRMMVERGLREIERMERQPVYQARLLHLVGRANIQLGNYSDARSLFERAVAVHTEQFGPDHRNVAESLASLADSERRLGNLDRADTLFHRALEIERSSLEPNDFKIANLLVQLHLVRRQQGDLDAAEQLIRQALAMQREVGDSLANKSTIATSINLLAAVLRRQGRYAESGPMYAEALRMRREAYGDVDNELIAESLNNMALQSLQVGDLIAADSLGHAATEMFRRLRGSDHPHTATAGSILARAYVGLGRADEAIPILEHALQVRVKALGPSHQLVARTETMLGQAYAALERWSLAESHSARAVALLRLSSSRADRRWLAQALNEQGVQRLAAGRPDLAVEALREAQVIRRELFGPEDSASIETSERLREALAARGVAGGAPGA